MAPTGSEWLHAATSVLSAAAWPVIILVLGLVYRKQITAALQRATHAKVGPVELDLERETAQAEAGASIVGNLIEERQEADPTPGRKPLTEYYAERAFSNPLNAVLEAYVTIEKWFDKALQDHGLNNHRGYDKLSALDMAEEASTAGLIPLSLVTSLKGLTILRQIHLKEGAALSTEDAQHFLTLAEGILYLLETELAKYDKAHPASEQKRTRPTVTDRG